MSIKSITALLYLLIFSVPSESAGCKFDSLFIGQLKRVVGSQSESTPVLNPRILKISVDVDQKFSRSSAAGTTPFDGYQIPVPIGTETEGYFLVFPGNSQLARTVIAKLIPVADIGYHVFAFDYRGLYSGAAIPTVEELIADTRWLVSHLNGDSHFHNHQNVVYGISSGGVLVLQALDTLSDNDRIILDSVPDKLPIFLWCDREIQPRTAIDNSRAHSIPVLVLNGALDQKVVPYNSKAIIKAVEANNGCTHVLPTGAHPFEDDDDSEARVHLIVEFLRRHDCKVLK